MTTVTLHDAEGRTWTPADNAALKPMIADPCRDTQGDTETAIDFLRRWEPDGPWLLTAIDPEAINPKKKIETQTFRPQWADDLRRWIDRHQGRNNIYFSTNRPSKHLTSKAEKADIAALLALHVDVDPSAVRHDDLYVEQQRLIASLKAHAPPPSVIVFSGGGAQAFWLLKDPVPISGTDDVLRFEAYNKALADGLGGDHCQNIDRIMRLPGTINVPDAKKRAKGRTRALARIVEADWDRRYTLDAFAGRSLTNDDSGSATTKPIDVDALPISSRIRDLIRGTNDPAHPYASRSEAVFAVLIAMAAAGCGDDAMEAVFLDPRLPISAHVREQPKHREYLTRQIAAARVAATDPHVGKLNKTYALVLVGDKAAILKEGLSTEGLRDFQLMGISAFKNWYCNRFVPQDNKQIPLAQHWLNHPQRRQYEGLVFAPGEEVPGYYNLYRGFAVTPRPGDCTKQLDHIRDNVCSGDATLFNWVIGWFAEIVQRPAQKSGTSLVIKGKQGTGKTIVGRMMGSLLGDHYVAVSDPRYVTGRFNSHLVSCLLLHADEGFWAGDHAAEGRLKDLITGDHQLIEFKGKEPVRVRNFVRLLVTGNPDWVVPASLEERRFAVIEISDARLQDTAYFCKIVDEMENAGSEALLHHLLHFDLTTVNLRDIPKTAALLEQKIASLTPEQKWWFDVLHSGRLPYGSEGAGRCPSELLFDAYIRHAQKVGFKHRGIETQIGMFLNKAIPPKGPKRVQGEYKVQGLMKEGTIYEFPSLAACRSHFAKVLKQPITWEAPDEWLPEPEPARDPSGQPF